MKEMLTWNATLYRGRPLWLTVTTTGAAVLASVMAITVVLAMGGKSSKPARTQRPAHTGHRIAPPCAPDDSLPVGPGGEGVPTC
jgi:hypothetical protein